MNPYQILNYSAVGFAFFAASIIIYGAIKRGTRRKISFLGLVIDVNLYDKKSNLHDTLEPAKKVEVKVVPIETRQSDKIVNQIRLQASFSYWVSMGFAIVVGLLMIIKILPQSWKHRFNYTL